VLSIIAILIALLLPSIGAAKASARRSVCLNLERQIAIGFAGYLNDNQFTYPYANPSWPGIYPYSYSVSGPQRPWMIMLSTVGYVVVEPSTDQLIAYAQKALAENGWGILVFHCVETGWLKVSQKAHREFLAWLATQPALWTAPVRDVGKWVEQHRA
jgi:hypothetical protein